MKIRNTILACVLSFITGGGITGYVLSVRFLDVSKITVCAFRESELCKAIDMAEKAYFNEPPIVAIWELKKLLASLSGEEDSLLYLGTNEYFNMSEFYKYNWAVAGARLIRTYEKQGEHQEANRCVSNYLSKVDMFWGISVTNKESILFVADSVDKRKKYKGEGSVP